MVASFSREERGGLWGLFHPDFSLEKLNHSMRAFVGLANSCNLTC
jgi:hypothetical protein